MTGQRYGDDFMRYTAGSSQYAATVVSSELAALLPIASVLDVGCATGTWLAAWREMGVSEVAGVDGDYVDRSALRIPQECFTALDVSKPFDLGQRFDLVQSLEVAEHVPGSAADDFVSNLARHARRYVLFSAAPPGQGGEFHINEQPYDYWRARFSRHGFRALDAVRPMVAGDGRVSFWYRYNTLLYVRDKLVQELPSLLAGCVLDPDEPVPDVSPLAFRVRKAIVRCLPAAFQDRLARAKARFLPSGRV